MAHNSELRYARNLVAAAFLLIGLGLKADTPPVSGDAHVNSVLPGINFGSAPFLQVGGTSRAYLKFDQSSLPPGLGPADVRKASLILWVGRVGTPGSVQVSDAGSGWDEGGVTWN